MKLFVTSSPYIDGAPRAILSNANHFIDRIREVLPPYPNVVFVCSNPDDHGGVCRFAAETCAAFLEAGIPFGSYQVLSGETVGRAYAMISHSDFVVLSGGHVPTQNAFFRKIRLRHMLHKYEGVVMGISAGSMNCAGEVYVQPEEPGESLDPNYRRFAPGLGLTWVNVCPHFQKVRHMMLDGVRLFEDITFHDSIDRQFFALPDNSYFYQDEDGLYLCGEAYRIKDGILEKLTVDGEVLDMAQLY
jgi:dipeptidase E